MASSPSTLRTTGRLVSSPMRRIPTCGWVVMAGEAVQVPLAAGIADGEGPALELVRGEPLGARARREILDRRREPGEREAGGMAHRPQHQPLLRLDRDADV